jgi:hypothetical protein
VLDARAEESLVTIAAMLHGTSDSVQCEKGAIVSRRLSRLVNDERVGAMAPDDAEVFTTGDLQALGYVEAVLTGADQRAEAGMDTDKRSQLHKQQLVAARLMACVRERRLGAPSGVGAGDASNDSIRADGGSAAEPDLPTMVLASQECVAVRQTDNCESDDDDGYSSATGSTPQSESSGSGGWVGASANAVEGEVGAETQSVKDAGDSDHEMSFSLQAV